MGADEFHVESRDRLPEGPVELRYEFEPTGQPDLAKGRGAPGRAQLYVNGALVGQAEFPVTMPLALGIGAGLAVGRNPGSSVSRLYEAPFEFTGRIGKIVADVSGQMIQDTGEEARVLREGGDGPAVSMDVAALVAFATRVSIVPTVVALGLRASPHDAAYLFRQPRRARAHSHLPAARTTGEHSGQRARPGREAAPG